MCERGRLNMCIRKNANIKIAHAFRIQNGNPKLKGLFYESHKNVPVIRTVWSKWITGFSSSSSFSCCQRAGVGAGVGRNVCAQPQT